MKWIIYLIFYFFEQNQNKTENFKVVLLKFKFLTEKTNKLIMKLSIWMGKEKKRKNIIFGGQSKF